MQDAIETTEPWLLELLLRRGPMTPKVRRLPGQGRKENDESPVAIADAVGLCIAAANVGT
jgi:hypothetical protein